MVKLTILIFRYKLAMLPDDLEDYWVVEYWNREQSRWIFVMHSWVNCNLIF
jgi:hypothetical protein